MAARRTFVIFVIFLIFFGNSMRIKANEQISVHLFMGSTYDGNFSYSANVRLAVRIERHKNNKNLELECDSDNFYTNSVKEIDGESPVQFIYELNLESGSYVCTGTLLRNNGDIFTDSTRFFVN